MRAFVTGIAGFAGSHLADALVAAGWEVSGLVAPGESLGHLRGCHDRVTLTEADVADADAVAGAIADAGPTCVVHLAAMAFVPESLTQPMRTYDVNVGGTVNVLEAIRTRCPDARVLCVSSADAYGAVEPEDLPITEAQPWRAVNPYAASKAATDVLADTYGRQYGLAIVRVRPFNHAGPRQSRRFVCADFARQIARIDAGVQEPVIRVGRLSARRDYCDVRDVVRAYMLLADAAVPCEAYNICSGVAVPVQAILDQLCALCGVPVTIEEEAARLRPLEVPEHRGTADALHQATGWRPEIPLEQTLADTLAYWRAEVAAEARVGS